MAGMLRVRRSRGAFSGFLLVLLGVWGGLVPLVGPYVHYAYTPDSSWTLTSGRVWLEIVPAGATVLGGLLVMITKLRPVAIAGAILAIVSGAWFAIGRTLMPLWTTTSQGAPVGGHIARAMEQIGFFAGLGIVIICVAAVALGGLSVISHRDKRHAERVVSDSSAVPSGAGIGPTGTSSGPGMPGTGPSWGRRFGLPSRGSGERAASDDQAGDSNDDKGTGSLRKVAVGSGRKSSTSSS
jgi:hypothetical protein